MESALVFAVVTMGILVFFALLIVIVSAKGAHSTAGSYIRPGDQQQIW